MVQPHRASHRPVPVAQQLELARRSTSTEDLSAPLHRRATQRRPASRAPGHAASLPGPETASPRFPCLRLRGRWEMGPKNPKLAKHARLTAVAADRRSARAENLSAVAAARELASGEARSLVCRQCQPAEQSPWCPRREPRARGRPRCVPLSLRQHRGRWGGYRVWGMTGCENPKRRVEFFSR